VLFFTDYDHQILPDAITLPGIGLGLAVAWFKPVPRDPGPRRARGIVRRSRARGGVLGGIGALYSRLRGVEAMGLATSR